MPESRTITLTPEKSAILTAYRSPLRYPGGKQKAVDQIGRMLPARVGEFREPMVGGGSIFFHARNTAFAKSYWINDKFEELICFWKTVQNPRNCAKLIADLEELHASFATATEIKEYFLRARKESPRSTYRRAILFFFFNRVTFSGTTRAGGFSSAASLRRFTQSSIERLRPMPEALTNVRITNDEYHKVIAAAGKDVFIFLDPPYFTASRLYGKNGSLHAFDHERLASALKKTKHRFLITYDDCDEIRRLYAWAKIEPWQLQYGMNNCNAGNLSKIGAEIFISNYDRYSGNPRSRS
jgi:DNA adenine methylase